MKLPASGGGYARAFVSRISREFRAIRSFRNKRERKKTRITRTQRQSSLEKSWDVFLIFNIGISLIFIAMAFIII